MFYLFFFSCIGSINIVDWTVDQQLVSAFVGLFVNGHML